jgi:hypothetical protein
MNILQKPNGPVIPGSADGRWRKRNLSCLNRGRTLSENIFMVIWDYKNYKKKKQTGRETDPGLSVFAGCVHNRSAAAMK